MKVSVVVGGRWHAPEVAAALRALMYDVEMLDPDELRGRHPLIGAIIALALTRGGRVPALTRVASIVFSAWAMLAVRKSRPNLILCWTGFAIPMALVYRRRMLLIRGSHHVRRQRRLLAGVAGNRDYPRWLDVVHQELEYLLVRRVSVPTPEIAKDPFWGRTLVSVARYAVEPLGHHVALAPDQQPLRVIFVGEPSYRKGFDFLQLVDASPLVGCVEIVGSGREPAGVVLSKALYRGRVAPEAVQALMSRAHVLVLLSREEGQARVGLEAAAVGLPLLVSRRSGLSHLCDAGGGVCLDEVTASTVADGLGRIQQEWSDMSRSALASARSWSWVDHATCLLESSEDLAHD